jgi:hypothetical protein
LKAIFYLACITALAFAGLMSWVSVTGEKFNGIELLVVALTVSVIVRWRLLVRRRERQKLEGMRDSALW